MSNFVDGSTMNQISMFSYIHGKNEDMSKAYNGMLNNTPRYADSTFDYRVYLTKSLAQDTTLDKSLFSLEFLYKNKIDTILNDAFKLNFLYDSNRSIKNTYLDLERVKNNNAIGIFDLSTCFYTKNYAEKLPLMSTFDSKKVREIIDNNKKFNRNAYEINDIIDYDSLNNDTNNSTWKNAILDQGTITFDMQNPDGTHLITIKCKDDSYVHSYYVNPKLKNHKFTRLYVNGSNDVEFIETRLSGDKTKLYALISVDHKTPNVYVYDLKDGFTTCNRIFDTEIDYFQMYFNNKAVNKLIDIFDYTNVTRNPIEIINTWKFIIDEKPIYIASYVGMTSEIEPNESPEYASKYFSIMYSYDKKTWNRCNIDIKSTISEIFDINNKRGLIIKQLNNKFYLYNSYLGKRIENVDTEEDKSPISLIYSDNLIDWTNNPEFNTVYRTDFVDFHENYLFVHGNHRYYKEEHCNHDTYEGHTPVIKVPYDDNQIIYYTKNLECKTIKSFGSVDKFKIGRVYFSGNHYYVAEIHQSGIDLYEFDPETAEIGKCVDVNITRLKQVRDRIFFTNNVDNAIKYIENGEIKTISFNLDKDYRVNGFDCVKYPNYSIIYAYLNSKKTDDGYIVYQYAISVEDDKIGEPLCFDMKDVDILKTPELIGNHCVYSINYENLKTNYIAKAEINSVTNELEIAKKRLYTPNEIADPVNFLKRVDKINGFVDDLGQNGIICSDGTNIITITFDIYGNVILNTYCIRSGRDFSTFIDEDYIYIPGRAINIKQDFLINPRLKHLFLANDMIFAIGKEVYFCNENSMLNTHHVGMDYNVFNLNSNESHGIFWDNHKKYCGVNKFIEYMSELPDKSKEKDYPDYNVVEFFLDKNDNHNKTYMNRVYYSDRYNGSVAVDCVYENSDLKLIKDENLTEFDPKIEYFEQNSDGEYVKTTDSSPQKVARTVLIPQDKIKIEINKTKDTEKVSGKYYYTLQKHENLSDFEFTKEYYTSDDEISFIQVDTATTTPDPAIIYYTFELDDDETLDSNTVYYTFDSVHYTENKESTVYDSKVYYHYETEQISKYYIYLSLNNIDFVKVESDDINFLDIRGVFLFKDKFFILSRSNEIYSCYYDKEKNIYTTKNILSYFVNGKLLTNDKIEDKFNVEMATTDRISGKILIGFKNSESFVMLSIGNLDDKSTWNAGEIRLSVPKDTSFYDEIYILDEYSLLSVPSSYDSKNNNTIQSINVLYSDKSYEFIDSVKDRYLKYYVFNKMLDTYYINLIFEFKDEFLHDTSDNITFYSFMKDFFSSDSESFAVRRIKKLYDYIVKMQEFITFVVSCHDIIEESIDIYTKIKEKSGIYSKYLEEIYVVPHIYNILYSIVDTRLSKIDNISENESVYEYFSRNLIRYNTTDKFKWAVYNQYEIIDPVRESSDFGSRRTVDNAIDKVYSVLTENYWKTKIILNEYDETEDDALKNKLPDIANKYFIKYLYMAVLLLQMFDVSSSVSNKNAPFKMTDFVELAKSFDIDVKRNYSEDEVFADVCNELRLV